MEPFCQGAEWEPRESPKVAGICGACGKELVGRNLWFCRSNLGDKDSCRTRYMQNHHWGTASTEAVRRAEWLCSNCGVYGSGAVLDLRLEVNHIEPRLGQGYGRGCWNHQGNLEVLCHVCHVIVTTQQRRERISTPVEIQQGTLL